MLARHPLTGKPIRILNCETNLWKDAATLVWLRANSDLTKPWNRYTVGVSSVADYRAVVAAGIKPDICVLLGSVENAVAWIQAGEWLNVSVALAPKAVLEAIGVAALRYYR